MSQVNQKAAPTKLVTIIQLSGYTDRYLAMDDSGQLAILQIFNDPVTPYYNYKIVVQGGPME